MGSPGPSRWRVRWPIRRVVGKTSRRGGGAGRQRVTVPLGGDEARFVRVRITGLGEVPAPWPTGPDGARREGETAWVYLDEIIVR